MIDWVAQAVGAKDRASTCYLILMNENLCLRNLLQKKTSLAPPSMSLFQATVAVVQWCCCTQMFKVALSCERHPSTSSAVAVVFKVFHSAFLFAKKATTITLLFVARVRRAA